MPRHPKRANIQGPLSPEEIRATLEEMAEALSKPRDVQSRREMVTSMLARRMRRAQIVSIVGKTFGVKANTIDQDIAWAKDYFIKWAKDRSSDQALTESLSTMNEAIQRGFKKDDLQAVVSAAKHQDTLLGLIRAEENTGGTLGVVIVPERMGREEWEKKNKKS